MLIKSPDILFPTVLWDFYVLWKKKKKKAFILIYFCKADRTRGKNIQAAFLKYVYSCKIKLSN